jgi:hypothetical protein
VVEKRKEKEDVQRKSVEDVVDYINLSLINIMSCDSFDAVKEGDGWVKKLTDEQKEYHLEHMDKPVFKKYSPEMEIEGNCLRTKHFGSDINSFDESSDEYKKGIDYALDAIKDLNDHGIYHGDILAGHDTANPHIHDRNIVYDGKEYRLIDFGPKTQKAEFSGKVDQKRVNNKNIPKPTIQLKVGDPVEWEQTLLENYKKGQGLREQAQKDSKKPPEMIRKPRKAKPPRGTKRGFRGSRSPPNFSLSPKQPKKNEGSSPSSSGSDSPGSESGLSDFDWRHEEKGNVAKSLWGKGKKKRRRTKKKRKRKRKYTRRKKKRKRRCTKKKRKKRR